MSANCDAIAIFLISGQFEAIRKPDSGCIVCKPYIFIKSNLLSYKIWLTMFLWVKVLLLRNNADFLHKKILTSAKLRGHLYEKVYFLKLNMCVFLHTKFQVSSMILTSCKRILMDPYKPQPD